MKLAFPQASCLQEGGASSPVGTGWREQANLASRTLLGNEGGFAPSSPGTKVNEVDLDARGGESAEPGGFPTLSRLGRESNLRSLPNLL
jgi:hypothetical protein